MLAGLWSLTLAAAAAVVCSQATLDPTCIGTGLCSNEFLRNSLTSQIKILTFVPQNLDPSITFLNLAGNNISSLNGSEFIRYFYLQKIDLTGNPFKSLPALQFGWNPRLQYIILSNTKASVIPPALFYYNTQLVEVEMDGMGISYIPAGLFRNNPNLVQVSLRSNSLGPDSIPESLFDYQQQTTMFIFLGNNPLLGLRERFFYGLSRPTNGTIQIDLGQTQLAYLPARVPWSVTFTTMDTNPGYLPWYCPFSLSSRVQYYTTPQIGATSNFCSLECKQCPPTTYELRSCNLTTGADTFCASLPPSCVRQGQCAGLGLSNLPSGIVSGVTVLNVTNNRIFGVELRLLQALLASGVQKILLAGNPGASSACTLWPVTSRNVTLDVCTEHCYDNDTSACPVKPQHWIAGNCSANLPVWCLPCSTTPCIRSDSHTIANCSLYIDKTCAPCTVCDSTQFITVPCSEYGNRQCQNCTECSASEYVAEPCGISSDAICGACDSACNGCTGPYNTSCIACANGSVSVSGPQYGITPPEFACVPYLPCPYSEWSDWENCTVPCGGGITSRSRDILTDWPCSDPQPVYEETPCNTDVCVYPTILVDITLKNITSARVNKTQEAQLGALVALILREPKSAVVFVSAETSYVNVSDVFFNETSDENSTSYFEEPQLSIRYLAFFQTPAAVLLAETRIYLFSTHAFSANVSRIIGFNVTSSVNVTIPPSLTSASPSPSRSPSPPAAPIPIAPIVAAVVVIAGIATVGGLCYRRRWYTRVNKQWMKAGVNKLLRRKLALSEKADIGGGATNGDSPTAAASPATLLAVAAFASGSKRRLMVGTDGLGTGSGSPSRSPSRTLVRASGSGSASPLVARGANWGKVRSALPLITAVKEGGDGSPAPASTSPITKRRLYVATGAGDGAAPPAFAFPASPSVSSPSHHASATPKRSSLKPVSTIVSPGDLSLASPGSLSPSRKASSSLRRTGKQSSPVIVPMDEVPASPLGRAGGGKGRKVSLLLPTPLEADPRANGNGEDSLNTLTLYA